MNEHLDASINRPPFPEIDMEMNEEQGIAFPPFCARCGDPEADSREYGCPYGRPGDRLWVKESWFTLSEYDKVPPSKLPKNVPIWYGLNELKSPYVGRTRSSIHMPRWASRATLEITDVRVQRLREISEEDAKAEGLSCHSKDGGVTLKYGIPDRDRLPGTNDDGWAWPDWNRDPIIAYRHLWDYINGKKPGCDWVSNPFVWAISFRRIAESNQKGLEIK